MGRMGGGSYSPYMLWRCFPRRGHPILPPSLSQALLEKGVHEDRILFLCIIAAPEGIRRVCDQFPAVKVSLATMANLEALNSLTSIYPSLPECTGGDKRDRISRRGRVHGNYWQGIEVLHLSEFCRPPIWTFYLPHALRSLPTAGNPWCRQLWGQVLL